MRANDPIATKANAPKAAAPKANPKANNPKANVTTGNVTRIAKTVSVPNSRATTSRHNRASRRASATAVAGGAGGVGAVVAATMTTTSNADLRRSRIKIKRISSDTRSRRMMLAKRSRRTIATHRRAPRRPPYSNPHRGQAHTMP